MYDKKGRLEKLKDRKEDKNQQDGERLELGEGAGVKGLIALRAQEVWVEGHFTNHCI